MYVFYVMFCIAIVVDITLNVSFCSLIPRFGKDVFSYFSYL